MCSETQTTQLKCRKMLQTFFRKSFDSSTDVSATLHSVYWNAGITFDFQAVVSVVSMLLLLLSPRAVIYCTKIINFYLCIFAECTSIRSTRHTEKIKDKLSKIHLETVQKKKQTNEWYFLSFNVLIYLQPGVKTLTYSPNCHISNNTIFNEKKN